MKESFHKKRRIKIILDDSDTVGDRVKNVLSEKKGIIEVSIDKVKGVIAVGYDLTSVAYVKIEEWLIDCEISLSQSLFDRWKRGWVKFTEQNELDNFSAKSTSCCQDPRAPHKNGSCSAVNKVGE